MFYINRIFGRYKIQDQSFERLVIGLILSLNRSAHKSYFRGNIQRHKQPQSFHNESIGIDFLFTEYLQTENATKIKTYHNRVSQLLYFARLYSKEQR